MTPTQLRLAAYLMEHPEVPWEWESKQHGFVYVAGVSPLDAIADRRMIRVHPDYCQGDVTRYSREGKTLLILHNESCDQFGDITGESPEHLWFTRHGGYFKLSKESGEVETLKQPEF